MNRYFAFGSNMSRARLEARVGVVTVLGQGLLQNYSHSFSHVGSDGTGKGNLLASAGALVRGVLYELSGEQRELLHPYEGGYDVVEVDIELVSAGARHRAYTYIDSRAGARVLPREDYVAHYLAGMREHDFPADYIAAIVAQSKRLPE